jgi:hypothetical protein
MSDAKLIVMYPFPKNVDAFEKIYQNEHVPLTVAKLGGKTKIVATKIPGSPPTYRSFLSHCRSLFSVHASSGSVRGI